METTRNVNKAAARVSAATRGILAVAILAGMAGLGGSAPVVRTTEGGKIVPFSTFTFEKFPELACPVECGDTSNGVAINYLGSSDTKGSWGEDLCKAESYVATCADIGN